MLLKYTECNHCDEGLFADLARYKTVEAYLQALVDEINKEPESEASDGPAFIPLDCAVKDAETGKLRWVIQDGEVSHEAGETIAWAGMLPASQRYFMSDDIIIEGDGFERELFFSWDK